MWTEKYKPKEINEIVGNHSAIQKMFEWLKNWNNIHIRGLKK